jgi:hypothetical protein
VEQTPKVLKLLEKKYKGVLQKSRPGKNNADPSNNGTANKGISVNNNKARPITGGLIERYQQQMQANRNNNNANNVNSVPITTPSSSRNGQPPENSDSAMANHKQQSYGGGFFYTTKDSGNGNPYQQQYHTGNAPMPMSSSLTQRLLTNLNAYTPMMNDTSNYNRAITLSNKQKIRRNLNYLSQANKANFVQVIKPISPLFRTGSSYTSLKKELSNISDSNNLLNAPPTPQSGYSKY